MSCTIGRRRYATVAGCVIALCGASGFAAPAGAAQRVPAAATPSAQAPQTTGTAALVRRFVEEAWNAGDYAVIPQIFATHYVAESLNAGTPPLGRQTHAQLAEHVREFRAAFPDLKMTVEDVVEAGDRAYVRTRLRGTHRGALFGMPPSGAPVEFVLAAVYRSAGGKLVGHDVLVDMLGLLQQVGALPRPPGPPGAMPPGAMPPGAMPPGAMPPSAMPPGAVTKPEASSPAAPPPQVRLRTLEPGMRWTYRVSGDLRPPGAPMALPMAGTITITIETLEFRGRPTPALKFAQELRPLGPPPGAPPTGAPPSSPPATGTGAPPGSSGQSIFGADGPPVGLFFFRQDPKTRNVYFIGDNHGPNGAIRAALGDGGLFIPGEWKQGTHYDKRLDWEGGGWTQNVMTVDGTETIVTGLGPRSSWRAPNASDSAEGIRIEGTDWWAPELGQPTQFDANTRLPDGTLLRIRAVLESTNVKT